MPASLVEEFRRCWLIALFGVVLFTAGIGILFWNEGRAVHTILSLDEALEYAVTLNPEEEQENSFEGRIVHLTGPILIGEPLTEPDYGIQVMAAKLKRRVQMYQWVEETIEHNFGSAVSSSVDSDSRTYYYTNEWRDDLIDSRSFYNQNGHKNPQKFPIESQTQVADQVFMGRYELCNAAKERMNNFVELTSDTRPEDSSIKLHMGLYYHSNDVFNPEVGDVRLLFSFAGIEGSYYTIVGQLRKNKIVPYETSRKSKVLLVYPGEYTLAEVFKREHQVQRNRTWGFRFMGWVLLFFGTMCTASLIHIMLRQVCVLSYWAPDVDYPTGTNIVLSLSLALLITSIAWVVHRPWIGASLLLAAASPFLYCARTVIQYDRLN